MDDKDVQFLNILLMFVTLSVPFLKLNEVSLMQSSNIAVVNVIFSSSISAIPICFSVSPSCQGAATFERSLSGSA